MSRLEKFFELNIPVIEYQEVIACTNKPLFNQKKLSSPLSQKRNLPGIDWNLDKQLRFLKNLKFTDEISRNGWKRYANKKFFFGLFYY